MESEPIPKEIVDQFRVIDAECIADALSALRLNSVPEGLSPLSPDMRICGPAVTLRQVPARDELNRAKHEQVLIQLCQPGDVLVIDQGGRTDASSWGSNIANDAANRSLEGVVLDGGCRDVQEIIKLGFPTFAQGQTLRHTHGRFQTVCLNNEPVQIGVSPFAVMVAPGDLMVGDAGGLVVVPRERVLEVLAIAQERHTVDEELGKVIAAGKVHGDPEVDDLIARARRIQRVEQAEGYRW